MKFFGKSYLTRGQTRIVLVDGVINESDETSETAQLRNSPAGL